MEFTARYRGRFGETFDFDGFFLVGRRVVAKLTVVVITPGHSFAVFQDREAVIVSCGDAGCFGDDFDFHRFFLGRRSAVPELTVIVLAPGHDLAGFQQRELWNSPPATAVASVIFLTSTGSFRS